MNLLNQIISFAVLYGMLIIAMTFHEFSHAFVAYRLGDNTAKFSGRLTLNPLAHIDPFWTLLLPLFLFISTGGRFVFGSAKPVPINYYSLQNPKRDMVWIGLSGPLANILLASLIALLVRYIPTHPVILFLLIQLAVINVVLAVFNMIPVPPLDGSRVLTGLLPEGMALRYAQIEPYSFIILVVLLWTGILGNIIWPTVNAILTFLGVNY